jgi:hypothetical protein
MSIQGTFLRKLPNGLIVIKVGGVEFVGRPVPKAA